jgi:hypothetical protein
MKGPFEVMNCLAAICHVLAASIELKAVQIIHGMTLVRKWPAT